MDQHATATSAAPAPQPDAAPLPASGTLHKELVVVVHGVGVREAGVATDLVSLALHKEAPVAGQGPLRARSGDWVPHASDDFHLREARRFADGPLRRTFGARLRRYRRYDGATITHERLVADFYWGDISGTGGDLVRVVAGLVRVVLGLSHAIRENAASVWPHRPGLRRVAGFAALVVHGPVFALNLILLGGVGLAWAVLGLQAGLMPVLAALGPAAPGLLLAALVASGVLAAVLVPVAPLAAGVAGLLAAGVLAALAAWAGPVWAVGPAAMLAGAVLGARSHAFLLRNLADWLILCGAAVLGLVALDALVWPGALALMMPDLYPPDGPSPALCDRRALPLYALGGWLLAAVMAAWSLAIGAGLVLLAARWWAPFDRHPQRPAQGPLAAAAPVDFLAAAVGLMTMLAFLILAAVWGTLRSLPVAVLPDHAPVDAALAMVLPAVLALVLVIAAGVAQVVRTQIAVGPVRDYMAAGPDRLAETGRLVVAAPLLRVLEGFLVVLALLGLARWADPGGAAAEALGWMQAQSGPLVLGLAGVAALLVGALRAPLAVGVGIATDVLIYLNSYSWTTEPVSAARQAARPAPARSLLEQAVIDPGRGLRWLTGRPPGPADPVRLRRRLARLGRGRLAPVLAEAPPARDSAGDRIPHGYWMRRRIHARMSVLMNELIANEAPACIAIVAHSQGTVIAIDMLDKAGHDWGKGRALRLVTMGSPYTFLYHRYFPASFPAHRQRPGLDCAAGGQGLVAWVNLFRTDDFIGTHLDAPRNRALGGPDGAWPRDVPLGSGGHTNYWVDGRILGPLALAVSGRSDGPGPATARSDRKAGAAAAGA